MRWSPPRRGRGSGRGRRGGGGGGPPPPGAHGGGRGGGAVEAGLHRFGLHGDAAGRSLGGAQPQPDAVERLDGADRHIGPDDRLRSGERVAKEFWVDGLVLVPVEPDEPVVVDVV